MRTATPPPPDNDPVGLALKEVGDRWTFLVLREAFYGVRRFGHMQRNLGISRTVLTSRLKRLVADGILERRQYRTDPPWFEYRLTPKGLDLYPAIVALLTWGESHVHSGDAAAVVLRHEPCGNDPDPILVCRRCGQLVDAHNTTAHARI
jgi:DNA-binding HxlR family transcriptional regulator